jgi:Lrp/AsnC family transcriptional regulator
MGKLDLIDRKILTELMNDASISVAAIADRVGLSQTPCWKRIQKLEAEGVLVRRVAIVDPAKIGLGLTAFVAVEASDHSEAWRTTFLDAIAETPEIMEVHRMAGEIDYLLRVIVPDMPAFDQFYQRFTARVAMRSVTSRFSMETVYVSTAYPLMDPAAARRHGARGH